MSKCDIMLGINFGADNMNNAVQLPDKTASFSNFLVDYAEQWKVVSIHEKDRELHEYLNIECGAGVFTHVINNTDIKIEYSDSIQVVINVMDDLAVVSQKVDDLFGLLEVLNHAYPK